MELRSCQLSGHSLNTPLLLVYYNNQPIIDNLIVVKFKCVSRGRPQGGRAVFIVYFGGNFKVVDVDSGINGMTFVD